jgi:hypothetical protein
MKGSNGHRQHVVITGNERNASIFLIRLLTHLGLDTGFSVDDLVRNQSQRSRSGLEHDIRHPRCPYIVRSTHYADHVTQTVKHGDVDILQIYVPYDGEPDTALAQRLTQLASQLPTAAAPVTWLDASRCQANSSYLFQQLQPVLGNFPYPLFCDVFAAVGGGQAATQYLDSNQAAATQSAHH